MPVLQELVHLAPDGEEGHCNLVLALAELGRHGEARATCQAALELHPDSERLRGLLAQMENAG